MLEEGNSLRLLAFGKSAIRWRKGAPAARGRAASLRLAFIDMTLPRIRVSELRQRQQISIRILEPGDSGAARRRPHTEIVLLHSGVPLEYNAFRAEILNRCCDVWNFPSKRR